MDAKTYFSCTGRGMDTAWRRDASACKEQIWYVYFRKKLEEIDTLTDLYYEIEETEWRKVTLWVKANSEKFLIQAEINDYSNWISTLD